MADLLLGGIAINEVLVDPNGASNFDTDGNGTAHATDEFIEFYNTSGAAIDISGVELWDAGVGNWFTFPPGTILQPGAHAMVMTGVQSGGTLPTGDPDDLFFDAGRGSALINNGGDNIIAYDPGADEYIAATFNGDALDDPTLGAGGYSGFSGTATQNGSGEDFGNDTDGQSLQREPDGSDTFNTNAPTPGTSNICFVAGTNIATPGGLKAVENIRVGDLLNTTGNGARKVIWIFGTTHSVATQIINPNQAPIRISRGALGNNLPHRDLWVSRQHRMLVSGKVVDKMFGTPEVLVAAHRLLALPGVSQVMGKGPVTYYHVLLDTHEVLIGEGARCESMYLGPEALKAIPDDGLRALEKRLGKSVHMLLMTPMPKARMFIKGSRAVTLIRRLYLNQKPLDETALDETALGAANATETACG